MTEDVDMAEHHHGTSKNTPVIEEALLKPDSEKIEKIAFHFGEIMDLLGLDRSDESLNGTPLRVAKMYVQEVFKGLKPDEKPEVKLFPNTYDYNEMLIEKDVQVQSYCEHHFVPIVGKAHVAYIPNGSVIGLSKINRIVRYFSKRPQVQERLTEQIAEELKSVLQTNDVAVVVDSHHMCVSSRGIEDGDSSTQTFHYSGVFKTNHQTRNEFLSRIK